LVITTQLSAEPMTTPVHFDQYAENYDEALNQGLSATGEGKDYFARRRIQWLTQCLSELGEHPYRLMDYGCGDGSTSEFLLAMNDESSVIGLDASGKSLELATRKYEGKRASFYPITQYEPRGELDLVYCNGVFHHIPIAERASAMDYIWRSLRPGGIFSLWENNPWNPGTRYVMSRIPFDHDAITLTPPEAARSLQTVGFEILHRDSLFYFPKQLKWLRWIEPHLSGLPFGGQYHVLCRKPGIAALGDATTPSSEPIGKRGQDTLSVPKVHTP
jgi:SAM-dependent methyltransferase